MEVSHRLQRFSQAVQAVAPKLPKGSGWRLWVVVIGMLFAKTPAVRVPVAQVVQPSRFYHSWTGSPPRAFT